MDPQNSNENNEELAQNRVVSDTPATTQQPATEFVPQPQPSQSAALGNTTSTADPGKKLGIAGLVLAFLVPIAGIVVSVVARNKSKKSGFDNKLALGGLVASIITTIVSVIIGIFLAFTVVAMVNGDFIVGKWDQTAAGLSPQPITSQVDADHLELKNDKTITWYSDNSDRSKNYATGTYRIEFGNKTNDEGQYGNSGSLYYTLTFNVKSYVDGDGKTQQSNRILQYLLAYSSKDRNSFSAIGPVDNIKGYTFTRSN